MDVEIFVSIRNGNELTMTNVLSGRPRPSVQEIYAADVNPAPPVLREESPTDGARLQDVSAERYYSKAWHDQEVEKVWRKAWQLAGRVEEIPNVGDHLVYDIVHDSLIVVRTGTDEIRAFVNSCLHRGTLLRTEGGCVKQFRCPFHGFTWSLEGKLIRLPAAWDFPHVDPEKFSLPQARVGLWGGFIFVNFDPDCEPLESYLEILPEHFKDFRLEDRYKAAHVAKVLPCNWKFAMEAFIEAFHVSCAHPQVMGYYGDQNTQYDIWPAVRHVDRMISVQGVPSPAFADLDPATTIAHMRRDVPFFAGAPIEDEPGDTARAKLASRARRRIAKSTGKDLSDLSDAESLDLIEYSLFPNMVPWGGQSLPICYRFRPLRDEPEQCIMEIMFLFAKRPNGTHPTPAALRWLGPDEPWSSAPELGSAGMVADQDTDNLKRIQRGVRASKKPGVTLARYQESRIRHFHETLDAYMAR
jgi:phenylpropionate dioxygenase-like ring-hydroxylating dioxygenase large terminal subunit